ncbi:DUF805 domain-containing protein [Paenibacillus sp. GSMTC-2017]|uniref:DUF805 domain-containing protein n=1 Tax=Paenibacillus sp. GSMTC-2017 TaxID=2794350 RepID=UPI0018DA292E|nr:DUF805 domain-containing protein [Paenibacillus sp. GSMTC-2017]
MLEEVHRKATPAKVETLRGGSLFNLFYVLVLLLLNSLTLISEYAVILVAIYSIALFLPTLAVTVRRLHDTGRSGLWYLISFVPFVGGIILLVLTILEGESGINNYGPDPKVFSQY